MRREYYSRNLSDIIDESLVIQIPERSRAIMAVSASFHIPTDTSLSLLTQRLTYTDAITLLQKAEAEGVKFEVKPEWGIDLPSEHERYICETIFKKPVILTNYPKEIKAFYMKVDEDGRTVAAADVLVPKIGEIIGGSQREHRLDVLKQRCIEMNLDPRAVWWYLDLRRYGTVPHAGFGLGFERLILFVTGLDNIRDVVPFPRWVGNSKF